MRVFRNLEEFEGAVGTHLGWSGWHEVTQEQIDLFAAATGDYQWIHVDVERARQSPVGGTVAHEYLTLSLIPRLVEQVYDIEGLTMGVNYGANDVCFSAPVPSGSRIRAGVELVSVAQAGFGYQSVDRVTIECEDQGETVCTAEVISVIVPGP